MLTIFVETSLGKTRQDISSSTRFIEEQLQEYQQKLNDAENALKEFKQKHIGMMPGQGGDYLRQAVRVSTPAASGATGSAGSDQPPRPTEAPAGGRRAGDFRGVGGQRNSSEIDGRIQALQKNLDQLRLHYTDLHPDILSTKRLIEKLEAEKKGELAKRKADPSGAEAQNPVYQQLTISIAEADATVASLGRAWRSISAGMPSCARRPT